MYYYSPGYKGWAPSVYKIQTKEIWWVTSDKVFHYDIYSKGHLENRLLDDKNLKEVSKDEFDKQLANFKVDLL
jgi:hypothetical protein